ncbi:MAG TPA: hypothetical protein VKR22_09925, partial [Acidimicrobiales bacterium]|nr:hypothetical protein [Acidimicrobiales bacterium]
AVVAPHWPDSVTVRVTERVPLVIVTARGGSFLVDASGRILAPAAASSSRPLLVSPTRVGHPGTWLAAAARPGLAVASAAQRLLTVPVRTVHVALDGTVQLDLGGGVGVKVGPDTAVDAKLVALASVLAAAPPPGPETIDVTVPGEPTVAAGGFAAA